MGGGGLERGGGVGFGGMAPVPHLFASRKYKRYGYGYGEIAKLVHGRSLAPATTVISHGARNAALPPVRCPDTSRGTGYTTRSSGGTSYNRPVRQINTARSGLSGLPSAIREDSSFEGPLPGRMCSGLTGKGKNRNLVSLSIEEREQYRKKLQRGKLSDAESQPTNWTAGEKKKKGK